MKMKTEFGKQIFPIYRQRSDEWDEKEGGNMKKVASFVLCFVLLLAISITAFAASESYTGTYNGYNYYTSLTASGANYSSYLSYANGETNLELIGGATLRNGSTTLNGYLYASGTSAISDGHSAPAGFTARSASCSYYIGGTWIQSLSV